jgi:hypothetical protein
LMDSSFSTCWIADTSKPGPAFSCRSNAIKTPDNFAVPLGPPAFLIISTA